MRNKYLSSSPLQTQKFGTILAKEILKIPAEKKAVVIGLEGDLGGGKTTFIQGFAQGLGIKERILSPTFVILKRFKIPKQKNMFYHIDCYRIEKPEELLSLGLKEVISNSQNIIAIEWVKKVRKVLPKETILIKFKFIDKNKRRISLVSAF